MALTLCLAVGGAGTAFAVSDIQTFRLENGLTVLIKEDRRFPLVSVRLFVKAGSAWEKPEEAGMFRGRLPGGFQACLVFFCSSGRQASFILCRYSSLRAR